MGVRPHECKVREGLGKTLPCVSCGFMAGNFTRCTMCKTSAHGICTTSTGLIRRTVINLYRFVVSIPLLIRTILRTFIFGILTLPKRTRSLLVSVFRAVLSLPKVIRGLARLVLSVVRFFHPQNLRQLSFRTLVYSFQKRLRTFRESCRVENLRRLSAKQLLVELCSNPCPRALVKGVVYTVCVVCGLCLLLVVFLEDVSTQGLRTLRLIHGDIRAFQTAVPSVRRVVVVEEHHEVLKYWYEAAQDGIIPEEGLTLLHFDSHSGISSLAHMEKTFPLFHWPTRIEELHHMIQDSDNFVMAASLTKLFKRYVWIWPSWDDKNHGHASEYDAYGVYLGWAKRVSPLDKREYKEICGCLVNDLKNMCRMRDSLNPQNSTYGLEISIEECHVMHRGIMEIVRDDVAQEKLETEVDWLKPDEPLLLDIDADFYGSANPIVDLKEVGFTDGMIYNISHAVGQIVCARSALQETSADRLLGNVINTVQRYRFCKFRTCQDPMNILKLKQAVLDLVTEEESEADFYGMFCVHNKRKLEALLETLLKYLLRLTSQQLHRLRWVGFCLRTSPKSFDFSPYGSFGVCKGKAPTATYNAPSKEEVMNRTALLQDILYDGVITPKFVSIARSVREGSAPRRHISLIENHLLATVFQVINKNNSAVHYDRDLFWGIHGWEVRERLVNTAGQMWGNIGV